MTLKYDISQFGRSWCLNNPLDLSNQTSSLFINKQIKKKNQKFFPFINFENPLYFLAELKVKFGLTSGTAYFFCKPYQNKNVDGNKEQDNSMSKKVEL
jgi:hypothetical protein